MSVRSNDSSLTISTLASAFIIGGATSIGLLYAYQQVNKVANRPDDEQSAAVPHRAFDDVTPPPLFHSSADAAALCSRPFGAATRNATFRFRSSTALLNHGSYGSIPADILAYHQKLISRVEEYPDLWFRFHSLRMTRAAISSVAAYLNTAAENIVWTNNATTAVNAVLASVPFKAGDVIVTPDLTYAACKLALIAAAKRSGATYVELPLPLPLTEASCVEIVGDFLRATNKVRFALFDVVTSPTAAVMPHEQLSRLCHQHDVLVMLDAAHAPGQMHVDLSAATCDFWTGNCHKWMFAPKGTAILYAQPQHHASLHPLVTSHNYNNADWTERFWMQGTRDDTAYVTVAAAIDFINSIGAERAKQYQSALADKAQTMLSAAWKTELDPLFPPSMRAPYLRIIELPFTVPDEHMTSWPVQKQYGDSLQYDWMIKYDLCVPTFAVPNSNRLFVRISAQIYNEMWEYERLANIVLAEKQLRSKT